MGEIEALIQGLGGFAEGFGGKQTVATLGPDALAKLHYEFGKRADALALASDSSIAHVYEWGMEGMESGRLWRANKIGAGANPRLQFSFIPSTKVVPLPEAAQADAAERGFERAEHIWANKAHDQEYTRVFEIRAGGPAPTRVSPGTSEWLLIYDKAGNPMYRKTWRNYSPYVGKFRAFFEYFWNTEPERILERQAADHLESQVKRQIESEIQRRAQAARRIMPPQALPGQFTVTVKGQPRRISGRPDQTILNSTRRKMKGMYK